METRERVLNIEKAQKFFESRVNTSTKSRQSLIVPSEFDVDWKGAKYRYPKDRAEVVSAGIKSDEVIIAKIGGKVVDTYRELRVMSGVKFSHTLTFIATHIPLEGYTLTDEMRAAAVKGHSRDDKFTRIVLVHNLDGFFFSAERYVEGELLSCLVITNGYGGQQEIDNIVATKFLNGIQLLSVHRYEQTKRGGGLCNLCGRDDCGYDGSGDFAAGTGSCGRPEGVGNVTVRPAPKFEYVESGHDWTGNSNWGDPYGYTEGMGGGGTPGNPWPGYIHSSIIDDALKQLLTLLQLQKIKDGSEEADIKKYQTIDYNHMHAMRQPGETVAQAVAKMKDYFIAQVIDFKSTGNYFYLGMALHPIMDAYASPHSGFKVFDGDFWSTNGMAMHYAELTVNAGNAKDYLNAKGAVTNIYAMINKLPSNPTNSSISNIFDQWLSGYSRSYMK